MKNKSTFLSLFSIGIALIINSHVSSSILLANQRTNQFSDKPISFIKISENTGFQLNNNPSIVESTPLFIDSVTTTITSGIGIDDGTMTIYCSGGTSPYEYSLNGGTFQASPQFTNLANGFYDLTIRDANEFTIDTIVEINTLKVTITSTEQLCPKTKTGTITISISPEGEPSFLYSIVGLPDNLVFSDSTSYVGDEYEHTFTQVKAGTHDIYIQDGAGRIFETTYYLEHLNPLSMNITTGYANCQVPIDGTDIGTITVEINGGTPTYIINSMQDFTWLDDSTVLLQNLLAGNYSFTIQDDNSCTINETVTVEPDPAKVITINPTINPPNIPVSYGTTIELSVNPVNASTANWTDEVIGEIISEGDLLTFALEDSRKIKYKAENLTTGCMLDYVFEIPMFKNDTTVYFISNSEFEPNSPKIYLESTDSLMPYVGGYSIINKYTKYVFNANYFTDTLFVYDSIKVTDTLVIDITLTGINPPDNLNTLKIYPNPTNNIVYINSGSTYQQMTDYKIKIVNTSGVLIFESNFNKQLFEVDISEFGETGLYFIQILDSSNQIVDVRKLILE